MRIFFVVLKYLGLGLLPAVGSFFLWQYQSPQFIYYTDGYYSKINGLSVGSIFVVNEGRSPETNLSIFISEKLSTSDVTIDYVSTKAEVSNVGNETRIIIPKLKPNEYAEIVFKSPTTNRNFTVSDVASDSGNITHRDWIKKSWLEFSKLQLAIIFIIFGVLFGLGFWIGSINNSTKQSPRSK